MIALVLALALVGAGCGGDDESSSDTDTVVTEETTTDETFTLDTTTDETDTDATDGLATGDCEELIDASTQLSEAFGAAGSNTDLDDVSDFFDEFADRAPEEIRSDFQVLADAYAAYATAFADVQLEAGETPDAEALQAMQEALSSIDQEELAAASQRISTWATTNC
jgi:hypothetical protein